MSKNQNNPIGQPSTSIAQNIRELSHLAKSEMRSSSRNNKLYLGSFIVMMAYEWGPGNDTLAPIITGRTLNLASGIGGIAITGAILAGFTYAQQMASSFLAIKSAEEYPKMAEKALHTINSEDSPNNNPRYRPFGELPKHKQLAYSFLIGSSFNVLRERFVIGRKDKKELLNIGHRSALLVASCVGTIAVAADIVDELAPENSPLKDGIEFLKNPLPWLGLMTGLIAKDALVSRIRSKRAVNTSNN